MKKEEVVVENTENPTKSDLEAIKEEVEADTAEEIPEVSEEISLEEEVSEEVEEEALAEEVSPEEAPTEESAEAAPTDETPAEETPEEEKAEEVVEEPTEEGADTPAEEPSEEEKPKKHIVKKVFAIIGIVIGSLALIYLLASLFFTYHFMIRTSVNGENCSGMSAKSVEKMMQERVDEYVLHITARDGSVEEIYGSDIDLKFNGMDVIDEAIEEQNGFLWVVGFYEENQVKATIDLDYDMEKLDAKIAELDVLREERQVEPVSAKPVYNGTEYVIQEEDLGATIDPSKLSMAIYESVSWVQDELDLHEAGCYVNPEFMKDSEETIAATEALNTCIQTQITYSLDGITVEVEKEDIVEWISVNDEMELKFNKKKMKNFAKKLGKKYNTKDGTGEIVTPTGKVAKVPGGHLGRRVGQTAEYKQLKKDLQTGTAITREPLFWREESSADNPAWGDTYVEVDISQQRMWYIRNNDVVFQSDVVTGSPGRDTPVGLFEVLEKLSPKVLTGYYPNGQLEYKTPVKYWLRVTWTGVGFHDATWQPAFGGQRYKQGYGSHGCINMPYSKVGQLYGMVKRGCPVVIHY